MRTTILNMLRSVFNRTFNSVGFGISLMVLTGLYIAIGSGVPAVREMFEMNEMQFFNAWPLKLLMGLLVLNLATVTWKRIPFTPPRYGVWCIHSGIVTLILGMSVYYAMKVEGMALIPVHQTVDHFYDSAERALYVQVIDTGPAAALQGGAIGSVRLASLPRFAAYPPEPDNTGRLDRPDLRRISPRVVRIDPLTGSPRQQSLADALGAAQPLSLDVVGYYPYARLDTDWVEDPQSDGHGVRLIIPSPHGTGGQPIAMDLVSSDDAQTSWRSLGPAEFQHVHLADRASMDLMKQAAGQLHQLDVRAGRYHQALYVEPGRSYTLGDSGYRIQIENVNPAFPAMNGQVVPLLTMIVYGPGNAPFRRQLIPGRDAPTDWKLNVPGAGPMGKRQTAPLDANLVTQYTLSDPMHLLPDQAPLKHTLVTAGNDGTDLFDIAVGLDKPTTITPMPGGSGQIDLALDVGTITLGVQRRDHLERQDSVQVIPAAQRTRQQGEEGALQVVLVRIRSGQWSQIVPVPFTRFAADSVSLWQGPEVNVPGARGALRLQLGNTRYALPVRITLERFDLDFYPGGRLLGATPRDFRSTLSIEDKQTGEPMVAVAHLNNPVYWPSGLLGGSWTFFQAQWDPQGQRWTILGVGNRHGTWLMLIGCVMIFAGLIYAFWCKPLIVRRMKAKAIERARAAGRHVAAPQMAEAR